MANRNASILFFSGLAGVVFYTVGPIIFPEVTHLRDKELLPVYLYMMGLGRLAKHDKESKLRYRKSQQQDSGDDADNE